MTTDTQLVCLNVADTLSVARRPASMASMLAGVGVKDLPGSPQCGSPPRSRPKSRTRRASANS